MSRDGLLPPRFSKVHKRFKTPAFATIITGIFVAVPTLFTNLTEMTDLTSIGTLMAFILVCGGLLLLDKEENGIRKGFRVPYYNSRYFLPPILVIILILIFYFYSDGLTGFFNLADPAHPGLSPWDVFKHKIPFLGFLLISVILVFQSVRKKLSLIPVLGLLTNLYLISELGITNWLRFLIWLAIGLVIYFLYGSRKSLLVRK